MAHVLRLRRYDWRLGPLTPSEWYFFPEQDGPPSVRAGETVYVFSVDRVI